MRNTHVSSGKKTLLSVVIDELRQLNVLLTLPSSVCWADESLSTWELDGLLVITVRTSSVAQAKTPSALCWQNNGVKC